MATAWVERRLAAILAADVVGYSRLVEQDEAGTLSALRTLRREVVDPLLSEHHGRIVKLMGDGSIIEFNSVVDAMACAIALQKGAAESQAEACRSNAGSWFRIGINLGDVVVEGAGSPRRRGQHRGPPRAALSEPGGVLISSTVYDHLQGKVNCHFDCLGEQRLKNIARAIRVYQMPPKAPAAVSRRPRMIGLPLPFCRSTTWVGIPSRFISVTASRRTSSPNSPASASSS